MKNRIITTVLLVLCLMMVFVGSANAQEDRYVIHLGTLGGPYSSATFINNKGQVIGGGPTTANTSEEHAFLWENGVLSDLGTLGGSETSALDLNEKGQVVGSSRTASGSLHAFLWENGVMTDLRPVAGSNSGARDINEKGQIAGFYQSPSGSRCFLWTNGSLIDLNIDTSYCLAEYISEQGQITGTFITPLSGEQHAYFWENGVMTDLGTLGGSYTGAAAVNGKGQVVGMSNTAAGEAHAFLWENGVMTDLGTLGGNFSYAVDINEKGQIAGVATTVSGYRHAFLWENGIMHDLGVLDLGMSSQGDIFDINESGQIVGRIYTDLSPNEGHAALWGNGVMTDLGAKAGWMNSEAISINDFGQIAGWAQTAGSYDSYDGILWISTIPLYVKPGGLTSGSCDNWGNACDLQYALTSAVSGQEIWTAAGVYKPTADPTGRAATFQLKKGVKLYGGFAGMESSRDQRDWQSHKTILSGDIDSNDINIDGNFIAETVADIQGGNTYHVVTSAGTDQTTVLDGFVITAGQAGDPGGGGLYNNGGSPTIKNIQFSANSSSSSGGGMSNFGSPSLTGILFEANSAGYGGGGLYNEGGSPALTNVEFSANSASPSGGGGMYVNGPSGASLYNVVFLENSGGGLQSMMGSGTMVNALFSGNDGYGIICLECFIQLYNVTISGNTGGGIRNDSSDPTIQNSIIWGNGGEDISNTNWSTPVVTYSIVPGDYGSTNFSGDPLFVDPTNGDFHLQAGSPAINSGTNMGCPSTDLDGVSRPQGFQCDMGAYERKAGPFPTTPTFVDVPKTHRYWQDIEILYANSLTGGCSTSPLKFCPDQIMNRAQAAAFMLRGNFGPSYVPPTPIHIFKDDWTKGPWAEGWAEGMKNEGFSAGCLASPLKYCPWDQIPREQAVIFALKLKYGKLYTPPPATGTVFADMTNPSFYATAWAEQAYKEGIIQNCGMSGSKPKFCPKSLVSRGLAAYMIVRAKNLMMP